MNARRQAEEVAGLLQWLAAELPQLPEAERAEALRCSPCPGVYLWFEDPENPHVTKDCA